jgi:hypothetical protein
LNPHVIHARRTYSHSWRADETVAGSAHLRTFMAGNGALFRSYPHFTDARSAA